MFTYLRNFNHFLLLPLLTSENEPKQESFLGMKNNLAKNVGDPEITKSKSLNTTNFQLL